MKKQTFTRCAGLMLAFALLLAAAFPVTAKSAVSGSKSTGIKLQIQATGEYTNWEGVSNVSQFAGADGSYCFAYDNSKSVVIVKTKNGKVQKGKITLKKKYPLFGGVTCDSKGNYYVAWGKENSGNDAEKETIFVSKYDKNGKHIKTVGDNGSSSLAYYYDSSFYTKKPFNGGNCDLAVNGNYLTVHYARGMYSGHQSNSALTVDTTTMEKVSPGSVYSSHSFAQRAIPYGDGFLLASEGDCYSRAFTVTTISDVNGGNCKSEDIFHFWVKQGSLDRWDMQAVNKNFAHMGGIASAADGNAALAGTSAKTLDEKAATDVEQLFIQIFDPKQSLTSPDAYKTSGSRTGTSGGNGDEKVTDYGVKWLTKYGKSYRISQPQLVAADGRYVVLYELFQNSAYKGVYYIVLDQDGNVVKDKTRYSKTARLNPCEMPVAVGDTVCWTGNKYKKDSTMYVYRLKLGE